MRVPPQSFKKPAQPAATLIGSSPIFRSPSMGWALTVMSVNRYPGEQDKICCQSVCSSLRTARVSVSAAVSPAVPSTHLEVQLHCVVPTTELRQKLSQHRPGREGLQFGTVGARHHDAHKISCGKRLGGQCLPVKVVRRSKEGVQRVPHLRGDDRVSDIRKFQSSRAELNTRANRERVLGPVYLGVRTRTAGMHPNRPIKHRSCSCAWRG